MNNRIINNRILFQVIGAFALATSTTHAQYKNRRLEDIKVDVEQKHVSAEYLAQQNRLLENRIAELNQCRRDLAKLSIVANIQNKYKSDLERFLAEFEPKRGQIPPTVFSASENIKRFIDG